MAKKFVSIAIDGPSGSGKSTLAKNLAAKLGFAYLDTGALYRTVGLYVMRAAADSGDAGAVEALLPRINIECVYSGGVQRMLLNGEDVTGAIRENAVSKYASDVSKIPAVRSFLMDIQKDAPKKGDVIMDGRDIGTVIMPNADVKIFLQATCEERAKRRFEELKDAQGLTYEKILADIKARDEQDSTRALAPLKPADDAVILDNSSFESPDQSLEAALRIIKEKRSDVAVR